MVLDAPDIESVLPEFLEFVGDGVLVAHNAGFDVGFIEQNCRYQEIEPDFVSVDTVALARVLLPTLSKYKLNIVARHWESLWKIITVRWMMQGQRRKFS